MTAVQSCELTPDREAVLLMGEGVCEVEVSGDGPQAGRVQLDTARTRWFLVGVNDRLVAVRFPDEQRPTTGDVVLDVSGLNEPTRLPTLFVGVWCEGQLEVASGWGVVWERPQW